MAEKLREQLGHQYRQETSDRTGVFIQRRRASAIQNTSRTTQDRSRQAIQPQQYDEEDDDVIYDQRPHTSARRYIQAPEVYTQGNRRIVVHREPLPKRRVHWMVFVGIALFIMVLGWVAFGALANWWQDKQNDWTYGNPRTFQMDQAVGINDSPANPSHFIAMNLLSFDDVNGDGKPDMLVHVAGFTIVLLNNGKTFVGKH